MTTSEQAEAEEEKEKEKIRKMSGHGWEVATILLISHLIASWMHKFKWLGED